MRAVNNARAQVAFEIVCKAFHGNIDKANVWFNTYNHSLGAVPFSLVKEGSIETLLRWIRIHFDKELEWMRKT